MKVLTGSPLSRGRRNGRYLLSSRRHLLSKGICYQAKGIC